MDLISIAGQQLEVDLHELVAKSEKPPTSVYQQLEASKSKVPRTMPSVQVPHEKTKGKTFHKQCLKTILKLDTGEHWIFWVKGVETFLICEFF